MDIRLLCDTMTWVIIKNNSQRVFQDFTFIYTSLEKNLLSMEFYPLAESNISFWMQMKKWSLSWQFNTSTSFVDEAAHVPMKTRRVYP